ncbi:2,5-didehydrogluconate reductase [Chlorella sorokiniana]|uniref:2,5-didehydrogluconate reductase n=1 Tax=Chlorella sorokiniana TaxID=3076 RepID=A0A2P6U0K6_CHLSO|nr:2,5-didehydrogluconate reductase [Chlorella sorokiniana]|eukprot:PRW59845.1 2,5-didehydrogluconate reductase [Chlorella sorokiniana]
MGLWSWGDSYTWGHGGYDATLTAATMQEAYQAALQGGCNLFDTAESYGAPFHWGASERYLANCMQAAGGDQAAGSGLRPVVVSKYIPLPWRLFEPRCMLAALRSSVDRLGVDAVDCYLVHSPVATLRSIKTLASSLAAAVDSGLAKSVGVSNYSEAEVRETHRVLAERGIPLAVNQVEFSLCHALPARSGLLDACNELGVSVMAYSPLAMGRLTGKYSSTNKPQGARRFGDCGFDQIQPIVERLAALGQAHGGKTPAQVALNWLICKGAVPIPGAKSATQAQSNVGALGWRLTEGDVAELDELAIEGSLKFGQHG